MFKEIYKRFDDLKSYIRGQIDFLVNMCDEIRTWTKNINTRLSDLPKISGMERTIESQQLTIEALTNALADKYEQGLFIYSEDNCAFTVIKNGEKLTNKFTTYFEVSWCPGEAPKLNIEEVL
jgi:hypothetical protein